MKAYKAKSGATQYKQSLKALIAASNAAVPSGYCLACGKKVSGVEPDARRYTCPKCGAEKVYGAEELVLMNLCY